MDWNAAWWSDLERRLEAPADLELADAGGREAGVAAGESQRDLGAVRLVADGHHSGLGALHDGQHVVGRRAGREPLVHPQRAAGGLRDCLGGLACAQQRAGQHELRPGLGELLGKRLRLLAPLLAQRPQLVGISRVGVGVADEVQAHVQLRIDSAPRRRRRPPARRRSPLDACGTVGAG